MQPPARRYQPVDPSIRIIRHPRARRLKLKVLRDASVELVAPPFAREREIRRFIARNEDWIASARQKMQRRISVRPALDPYPPLLELRAIGERVPVEYRSGGRSSGLQWHDRGLSISLSDADPSSVRNWLIAALKQRAGVELRARLDHLAARHGFQFARVTWRNQKTRWGSCSTRATLSLNVRLLFVPRELADYVLVHELAHLDHPDHSPAFWRRVEQLMPGYRHCERELKRAHRYLPEWIF